MQEKNHTKSGGGMILEPQPFSGQPDICMYHQRNDGGESRGNVGRPGRNQQRSRTLQSAASQLRLAMQLVYSKTGAAGHCSGTRDIRAII